MILLFWIGTQQSIAQAGTPTLSCRLNVPSIPVGGQAELLLEIQNVQNFYGYELMLGYDPATVEILDGDPNREQVNAQLGDFLSQDFLMLNEINQPGELLLNLMQIDPTPARSGNGLLAHIALIGRGAGLATFTLADVFLYDANGEEMASQTQNCSLQIGESAVPTPTVTVVPPTATPSPTSTPTDAPTPTHTPTSTPTELAATATASPPPFATVEPPLSTPIPPMENSVEANATTSSDAAESATVNSLSPDASLELLFLPYISNGNDATPIVQAVAVETEGSQPLAKVEPTSSSNESIVPVTANPLSTDAPLGVLFLPHVSDGGDSTRTVQAASVETGWSQPLDKVEPTSLPLSAAELQHTRSDSGSPIALIDLYFVILLFGMFAVGTIGFGLLVIIASVLFVPLQLSQRDVFVHPSRRLRSGKMYL